MSNLISALRELVSDAQVAVKVGGALDSGRIGSAEVAEAIAQVASRGAVAPAETRRPAGARRATEVAKAA